MCIESYTVTLLCTEPKSFMSKVACGAASYLRFL